MPYKTIDELPAAVKDAYDEAGQEKFLSAYNAKQKECMDADGEACDDDAMQAGHTAAKQAEKSRKPKNRVQAFLQKVERLIEGYFLTDEKTRAVSIDSIYSQVWEACEAVSPYCWVNNLYYEDDGQPFAVITNEGKLYRTDVTITDGAVTLGEWVEVKIDFPPVTQNRVSLQRQADGKVRWFSVAASNALNRSGEIDSSTLFESFVAHIEATGEYPIRQFYHAGGVFRTGQHDFVATYTQDGVALLITSGLYDDTELARREIAAREKEPEYWGNSIGFLPTETPELLEVADGVEIPVYTRGILREESTLPETSAAAWMTAVPTLTEVTRMLGAKQLEEFVKLFDGDEAAAQAWLDEHAATRAQKIHEAGMITRDAEPPAADPAPATPAPDAAAQAPLVLDEEAVGAIARAIVESDGFTALVNPLTERMTALEAKVAELTTQATTQATEATEARTRLETRLRALEATDAEKQKTWLADLPPAQRTGVNVTYRPRAAQAPAEDPAPTMSDIAAETLKRAPVGY